MNNLKCIGSSKFFSKFFVPSFNENKLLDVISILILFKELFEIMLIQKKDIIEKNIKNFIVLFFGIDFK